MRNGCIYLHDAYVVTYDFSRNKFNYFPYNIASDDALSPLGDRVNFVISVRSSVTGLGFASERADWPARACAPHRADTKEERFKKQFRRRRQSILQSLEKYAFAYGTRTGIAHPATTWSWSLPSLGKSFPAFECQVLGWPAVSKGESAAKERAKYLETARTQTSSCKTRLVITVCGWALQLDMGFHMRESVRQFVLSCVAVHAES